MATIAGMTILSAISKVFHNFNLQKCVAKKPLKDNSTIIKVIGSYVIHIHVVQKTQTFTLNVTDIYDSTLLSCEGSLPPDLVTPR